MRVVIVFLLVCGIKMAIHICLTEQIDVGTMGLKAPLRNHFPLIIVYDNQNIAFISF